MIVSIERTLNLLLPPLLLNAVDPVTTESKQRDRKKKKDRRKLRVIFKASPFECGKQQDASACDQAESDRARCQQIIFALTIHAYSIA